MQGDTLYRFPVSVNAMEKSGQKWWANGCVIIKTLPLTQISGQAAGTCEFHEVKFVWVRVTPAIGKRTLDQMVEALKQPDLLPDIRTEPF